MGTQVEKQESISKESHDEAQMIEKINRGNQQAFTKLVSLYEKSVYRICYRFFGNEEDSLDATQEVFVKIFRAFNRFEGRSSLKTWIYRITANTCISIANKKKREKDGLLQNLLQWWSDRKQDTPEEEVIGRETRLMNQKMVNKKIAALPEAYRMPIVLKDMEGLSLERIAEILEIPTGTVKSRINRGRRMLQESLQAYVYGRAE